MCEMQQGSMLGPLLSLIFINDYSSASKSFEMFFFADDKNFNTLGRTAPEVQINSTKLSVWPNSNKFAKL